MECPKRLVWVEMMESFGRVAVVGDGVVVGGLTVRNWIDPAVQ